MKAKASELRENEAVKQHSGNRKTAGDLEVNIRDSNHQGEHKLKQEKKHLPIKRTAKRATIPMASLSPPFRLESALTIVTIFSALMLIGLFVWAVCIHDGV